MPVKQQFNNYTALIDGALLSGIEKLWIWDNAAMSKVSWDFVIHDFPPSFVSKELQSIQTKYLKKWSGLAVRADPKKWPLSTRSKSDPSPPASNI